jgi:SAM-dependent methyltransferase
MMRRASPRQQKIAAAYDADIWPLVPARAAEAILRALPRRLATAVFEAGCATGRLTLAMAERLEGPGRIVAVDASPAMIERAEQERARHPEWDPGKVSFRVAEPASASPSAAAGLSGPEEGGYDLALSNLSLGEAPEPAATIAALARGLKPGGRALVALPLRGCWGEFLDLYRDVLGEQGKREALAAYEATLPEPATALRWLEEAGLGNPTIETLRWELLFKSAREFFFAPVIEFFPLAQWKQIAGGRGDEMQDVFFFVKEAIETYFAGAIFPVTMVVGLLQGTKLAP